MTYSNLIFFHNFQISRKLVKEFQILGIISLSGIIIAAIKSFSISKFFIIFDIFFQVIKFFLFLIFLAEELRNFFGIVSFSSTL